MSPVEVVVVAVVVGLLFGRADALVPGRSELLSCRTSNHDGYNTDANFHWFQFERPLIPGDVIIYRFTYIDPLMGNWGINILAGSTYSDWSPVLMHWNFQVRTPNGANPFWALADASGLGAVGQTWGPSITLPLPPFNFHGDNVMRVEVGPGNYEIYLNNLLVTSFPHRRPISTSGGIMTYLNAAVLLKEVEFRCANMPFQADEGGSNGNGNGNGDDNEGYGSSSSSGGGGNGQSSSGSLTLAINGSCGGDNDGQAEFFDRNDEQVGTVYLNSGDYNFAVKTTPSQMMVTGTPGKQSPYSVRGSQRKFGVSVDSCSIRMASLSGR